MNMIAKEKQAEIIYKACKKAGLDAHIKWIMTRKDAVTMAEQIAYRFRTARLRDKSLPVKNSFVFCDTLDMSFFFDAKNRACFSFSGYTYSGSDDICQNRLLKAFTKAENIVDYMQELMNEELANAGLL